MFRSLSVTRAMPVSVNQPQRSWSVQGIDCRRMPNGNTPLKRVLCQIFSTNGSNGGDMVVKPDSCDVADGRFINTSRLNLTDFAWYCANAYDINEPFNLSTYPVAEKTPNPWGFYDMHSNVSEWVYDTEVGFGFGGSEYWNYTPDSAFGLLRGGGFYDQPEQLSNFYVFEQMDRQYAQAYAGFRLVRRLEY